ncbi:MAG: NifB/NifX family molybdenum-iron cluster-binding protein [Candidatus Marinimicrobia bacterium]|nr:NifB/NifX family molybdenum-iron cluster-binding protein [Candidatus Neomarinimicrobiota bacterium]
MKIAIPLTGGKLSAHFGHCEEFGIYEVDDEKIITSELVTPPPHEPGAYPRWLHELGVNVIVGGGMGNRAQSLFHQNQIDVYYGVTVAEPDEIVKTYLAGTLESGVNLCDH